MPEMRVLMMISSFQMGGSERILINLLPHLKSLVDVKVMTMQTQRDSVLADQFAQTGIERIDIGARKLLDWSAWQRFMRLLRTGEFDVIHAQDLYTAFYAGMACQRTGIPTVMTRHVLNDTTGSFNEKMRAWLMLLAARFNSYHGIIAVSEAVRQRFAETAHLPLTRIETIYNGIDVELFNTRAQRASKRQELGWEADSPVIIMVAVLRDGKGHEVLFEAIPRLTTAVPGVKIKLVGDGELEDRLRQQAASYAETVEFMGQRSDVAELLGASDVLVLPSYFEALPTVLIEAGAASLPAVATSVGGAPEIINDGTTGYLVQPGDPSALADRLIAVLSDRERAEALGKAARQKVSAQFSLSNQAQQTVNVYQKVLEERAKTR
jgi:glycosyltransferase involved in cell wall biosynthesis